MITHGVTPGVGATAESAALIEKGMEAIKAGNKEAALAVFSLATQIEPSNETAWLWLASLYTDLPLVAQCLQRVLALNPNNEKAKRALESVLAKMQNRETQTARGTATPQQNYGNSGPLSSGPLNRVLQSYGSPQPESELETQTPINTIWPMKQSMAKLEYDELKRRGIIAAKGGRHEEAAEYLMATVEKNESDAEAWYWLSTVIEDPEDKQIALENVLILDPENLVASAAAQANAPLAEQRRAEKKAAEERIAEEQQLEQAMEQGADPFATLKAGSADTSGAMRAASGSRLMTQIANGLSGVPTSMAAGQIVADRYTVLRSMRGGADVAAWDARKGRFYILRPHYGDVPDLSVINTEGNVTHAGVSYTVIPIETKGLSLSSFIRTVGALPPTLVTQYGMSMLKTLESEQSSNPNASAQKSLRPDTITLDSDCNISLEPPPDSHSTMSLSNDAVPYIPPEQLEKGLLSPTSDIYSIGAILFFMLTGTPPSPDRIPVKQGDRFVPPHFAGFGDVPQELAQVVATAMQANPLERYSTASAMYDALKATVSTRWSAPSFNFSGNAVKITVAAVVIGALVLGLVFIGGKIKGGLFGNGDGQDPSAVLAATPVAVLAPTPVPPPPLARMLLNSVDSRRFPSNIAYMSALDPAGLPISGLWSDAVKLKENGQDVVPLQLIQLNKTIDPISVIVALDTSAGMSGRPMDDAKTALHILADLLQPGDQMALITFGGTAQLARPYTVSKTAFLDGVDRQEPGDKRALEDAVALASRTVMEQPQGGYTALIVVTNGSIDVKPDLTQLTSQANQGNLPVFFLGLDPATYPKEAAEQWSLGTGGVAFMAERAEAGPVGEAMKLIEKQLHNVYKLTFDSHAPGYGVEHRLELTLTVGPEVRTETRTYQVWSK